MTRPRGPSLSRERTVLAWTRSGLAIVLVAGVALREGIAEHRVLAGSLVCGVLLTAAAATAQHVARRHAALRAGAADDPRARHRALRLLTATALLAAAGGLALVAIG